MAGKSKSGFGFKSGFSHFSQGWAGFGFGFGFEHRWICPSLAIMLNPIEKFKSSILHLNRDWNH